MDRRELLRMAAITAAATALKTARAAKVAGEKKTIALLLYPEFTALDLVGPHHVFSMLTDFEVKLVAKSMAGVTCDTGLTMQPTATLEDCPEDLALIFVPGGTRGTLKAMEDEAILEFLRSRGERADYVTSVCTGSLVLGAAGLLRGFKATTHWLATDVLRSLGAEFTDGRVVIDRNRMTGGGVTAGIDFGLTVAARLVDEAYAKSIQLLMEYAPAPPFASGSPTQAAEETVTHLRSMFRPFVEAADAAAKRASARW